MKRNISKKSRGMFMQEQMHVLYRLGRLSVVEMEMNP
jgi:hypothetical protein